jgi:carboxypeptidase C (cathepsin A)
MSRSRVWISAVVAAWVAAAPALVLGQAKDDKTEVVKTEIQQTDASKLTDFKAEQQASKGSVTVGGVAIPYDAYAGTIVVHPKGYDDVPQNRDPNDKSLQPQASMFYVAYFKSDTKGAPRPVTFLYNGGPGASTVWLHMGAFGPRRVVTADDTHTPAAPYSVVNNDFSLLDASDLVFVDAPGTGFGRLAGKDKEKAFWGIDADGEAFADFIVQFLAKYGRWNSPKYVFWRKLRDDAVGGVGEYSGDREIVRSQWRDFVVADFEL